MKTIGLLGGMSWESTQSYYRALNEGVRNRLGGLHSAQILLYSVDFAEIEALQSAERWDEAGDRLARAAVALERAGADFLLIGTNTMHRVAPRIEQQITIPLLHIADATAEALKQDGVSRVGLLGTRFTMEQSFYRDRIQSHGIEVIVPSEEDRTLVDKVIYSELCQGIINPDSRESYRQVIDSLAARGVEAVILGCTEIALLCDNRDASVPLYDTAQIHAEQAVSHALKTD